ncbi:hypothetical protein NLJ89_g4134 [Agrocybe chaxingu]|uniref:Secreted protein n=1 Tax=Agrocybe chaxingu TaxID=84603 RepID=A0A9W8MWT5_9AGAR|nr:hypothetical protein NLJ89_g4134 [Agrocybe chaxingu]
MILHTGLGFFFLSIFAKLAAASPAVDIEELEGRQAVDNIVYVTDANLFCMIMPRNPHTNIGDSEYPGGMKTYCSPAGRYSSQQGQLPPDFWSNVEFKTGYSSRGARFAQRKTIAKLEDYPSYSHGLFSSLVTGCIRPEKLSRLNTNDPGGQYDSSGGAGGQGNPQGSKCLGYNHYVELVEPADRRACIKCCDNFNDCPCI